MKQVIFIKLGGSLITDKNTEFAAKVLVIKRLVAEIKNCLEQEKYFLIGNGSGSFGHMVAKKYQTNKGFKDKNSLLGAALTEQAAVEINRIVLQQFLLQKIPAISISPLAIFDNKLGKPRQIFTSTVEQLIDGKFLPLVYGDVVLDRKNKFGIFSADQILKFLALEFTKKGWLVEKIIHCGITDGVYDKYKQTIPIINKNNFARIKSSLTGSAGIDVTGGMIHKVEESLVLAKKGINSLIINGQVDGNLSKAILGKPVIATRIEK